jgi:hypothetical protein
MEVSGQLHVLAALPLGKEPLVRRLDGSQSRPGQYEEEKFIFLPGIEPRPYSPSLYRLSYPDSESSCVKSYVLFRTVRGYNCILGNS